MFHRHCSSARGPALEQPEKHAAVRLVAQDGAGLSIGFSGGSKAGAEIRNGFSAPYASREGDSDIPFQKAAIVANWRREVTSGRASSERTLRQSRGRKLSSSDLTTREQR